MQRQPGVVLLLAQRSSGDGAHPSSNSTPSARASARSSRDAARRGLFSPQRGAEGDSGRRRRSRRCNLSHRGLPRKASPARVFQSNGFTPAAATRTRTSIGPGAGRGSSVTPSTSGPLADGYGRSLRFRARRRKRWAELDAVADWNRVKTNNGSASRRTARHCAVREWRRPPYPTATRR